MRTVTIFCSSYNEIDKQHFDDVEEITKLLVEHGCKIIFDGGAGTLEELYYSITCNWLQGIEKPIIIFNKSGLFDSLLELTKNLVKQGFQTKDYGIAVSDTKDLIDFF